MRYQFTFLDPDTEDEFDCEAELRVDYTTGREATGPSMDNAGGDPSEPPDWEIQVLRVWRIEGKDRIPLKEYQPIEDYLTDGDGVDGVLEAYLEGSEPDWDAIAESREESRRERAMRGEDF